jgi:hypothetical protein
MSKLPATASIALNVNVYHVYVVTNTKTGGKYVSVRKNISATAFWNLLRVGARDRNFNQPIHESIRDMHDENRKLDESHHTIRCIATYTSKKEARVHATNLIQNNAWKARALNAARPAADPEVEFYWKSEEETLAELAAAKKVAKRTKVVAETTVE